MKKKKKKHFPIDQLFSIEHRVKMYALFKQLSTFHLSKTIYKCFSPSDKQFDFSAVPSNLRIYIAIYDDTVWKEKLVRLSCTKFLILIIGLSWLLGTRYWNITYNRELFIKLKSLAFGKFMYSRKVRVSYEFDTISL